MKGYVIGLMLDQNRAQTTPNDVHRFHQVNERVCNRLNQTLNKVDMGRVVLDPTQFTSK